MYTFSEEHKNYLKKIRNDKIFISIFRIIIVVLFVLIWEILARLSIINTFLYSSPSMIIKTMFSLIRDGNLFNHIGITLYEVLISFSLTTVVSIFLAWLLWSNEKLSKILDPYITVINSLPKVALGPLIIIWVGASMNSIIFMALTISLFTTIINIYTGFVSVNQNYITMLKSFGASKYQIFRKVIFPSNVENIISSLKINISMSLIGM